MFERNNVELRLVRVFALVLAAVALAVLIIDYSTATGGASLLQGLLRDGERPSWYWTRMEASGYEVTAVSYARNHYLEYQVVKGRESYEVQLELDADSGTVAEINIVDLGQAAIVQR